MRAVSDWPPTVATPRPTIFALFSVVLARALSRFACKVRAEEATGNRIERRCFEAFARIKKPGRVRGCVYRLVRKEGEDSRVCRCSAIGASMDERYPSISEFFARI